MDSSCKEGGKCPNHEKSKNEKETNSEPGMSLNLPEEVVEPNGKEKGEDCIPGKCGCSGENGRQ